MWTVMDMRLAKLARCRGLPLEVVDQLRQARRLHHNAVSGTRKVPGELTSTDRERPNRARILGRW